MITPTLKLEEELWNKGFSCVCGLDEVGRGSFAGPVAAGAVVFPCNVILPEGIADSKLLTPKRREKLTVQIKEVALAWSVAVVGVSYINKLGIGKATQMAFRKAVRNLHPRPDYILFDAFYNFRSAKISSFAYIKHLNRKRQKPVKDGDKICASISAASIIAKFYRDNLMKKLHQKYPQYGLAKHKGYGTGEHQEAIKRYGLSRIHRKSFNLTRFTTND
ncbi:ribonuclease HII [Candidatus Daviesbacteria bacterium RIFCSPLOWO2_01_FULL_43_38]|uniref:Ribonuclease HII n=2 Tax=Candidatus Daviesiibacteriota TaxID=1752718 RepID=A0A1F5K006_9BACT|nr:MAG: Ribonuclease HII [Candidatus Daviesbacteria bacterium GW2011_GWA1_42_6]OGE34239.1 MAG: ribonuclease HII [Candidatus Daviesbacteria bacterium RIFCSPHIGHO2_12_FULL_43_11]OGE63747.1 MAG: ribonuclease HII [Candidatus Daviesbacteria bacterium RIFCSPLOWO2_01_FULL_43_38]OGE69257.1 MAG: ribonuclease HII [Candidatus Daviesbacteria bacterium RIFCSPLOWO2_02_FULL_43_11]